MVTRRSERQPNARTSRHRRATASALGATLLLGSAVAAHAAGSGSITGPVATDALEVATRGTVDPVVTTTTTTIPPVDPARVSDTFEGTGPLLGYTTTNPDVLPDVGRVDGRYRAELTNNESNRTLHFNDRQGRLDAKLVSFPFDYTARNIGIGTLTDSQLAPNRDGSTFMFAGVQVHSTDLVAAESAHVVVGHRGTTKFTIEGKNTVGGRSSVNDIGAGTAPDGRADIRIVGNADRTLTVYWQTPNFGAPADDDWQLYRGTGRLPGQTAAFGPTVYIGLITYAYGAGNVDFVGTADSVELAGE